MYIFFLINLLSIGVGCNLKERHFFQYQSEKRQQLENCYHVYDYYINQKYVLLHVHDYI